MLSSKKNHAFISLTDFMLPKLSFISCGVLSSESEMVILYTVRYEVTLKFSDNVSSAVMKHRPVKL
jgi:hypothetical protein